MGDPLNFRSNRRLFVLMVAALAVLSSIVDLTGLQAFLKASPWIVWMMFWAVLIGVCGWLEMRAVRLGTGRGPVNR